MVGLGAAALLLPIFKARLSGIFSLLALPSDFYFLSSPSQVAKFSMVVFISKQDVEQWETVSNGRVPVSEKWELQTIFPSENGTCVRVAHWDDSRDFSQYIIVRIRPVDDKKFPVLYLHRTFFEQKCPEWLQKEKTPHKLKELELPVSFYGVRILQYRYYENRLPVFKRRDRRSMDSEAAAFEA
ncbi:hypothetical protein IWZ03DRAFT_52175 [Phyllosticta citriasiana]|uniref:Uncharacterized protein n=1 Tax=Phyllosticta citriasiana TaxID=595635 RepID=A0ABR1KCH0_9PEZI